MPHADSAIEARDALVGGAVDRRFDRPWMGGAVLLAAVLHVALAWGLLRTPPASPGQALEERTKMIELAPVEPPAPPLPPLTPQPPMAPAPAAPRRPTEAPPTAAVARAAAVVTRQIAPDEPADLSGDFVLGSASTYAGGTTTSAGTGAAGPTRGAAPGAAASASAPPPWEVGPDRSRRAGTAGGVSWSCPFPPETDENQVVVQLQVELDAAGKVTHIAVTRDPGNGFAREARRCAIAMPWAAALDREGTSVAGTTVVNVHFDR